MQFILPFLKVQRSHLGVLCVSSFSKQRSIVTLILVFLLLFQLLLPFPPRLLALSMLCLHFPHLYIWRNMLVWIAGALLTSPLVQLLKISCHCSKSVVYFCLYFHKKVWPFIAVAVVFFEEWRSVPIHWHNLNSFPEYASVTGLSVYPE